MSDGQQKTILYAKLQRFRSYRVRIESLEDVEIPECVYTVLEISMTDRNY